MRPRSILTQAARLKTLIGTLLLAYRHPDTPFHAKIWLMIVLGYALSPIDLIPDFIPIVGYLDDLILISIGVYIALKLIPKEVIEACEDMETSSASTSVGWLGAGIIVLIWVICLMGLVMWIR